jgi:hypothetical protein
MVSAVRSTGLGSAGHYAFEAWVYQTYAIPQLAYVCNDYGNMCNDTLQPWHGLHMHLKKILCY